MHLGSEFYTDEELSHLPFKHIGSNVKIKKTAGLYFVENISLGDNVRIDDFSIIVASTNLTFISSNVHIASHCYIAASGGFTMNAFSGLAPGVCIFTGSDDYSGKKLTNPTVPKKYTGGTTAPVILGRHVIIGTNSVILPGVNIDDGSSVGAQSLVTKSLDAWGVYFGSPVRKIKNRSKELLLLEKEYLSQLL